MNSFEKIKTLVFNSSIDKSLDLAVSLIKSINSSNYYCLNLTDIEEFLITKVLSLSSITFEEKHFVQEQVLFVISEGYSTGGHTRLMENLSTMLKGKHVLLITRSTENEVIESFRKYFKSIKISLKESDNLSYIFEIVKNIIKYEKVVLNTHPDDIFTIVACGIAKKINNKLKVYFVNHADNLATYGVTVSDIWFEISLYGQVLDKDRGILPTTITSFLGIPINKPDECFFGGVNYDYKKNGNRFLTAATSYKYSSIERISLAPLLESILVDNINNEVSIIGLKAKLNNSFIELKELKKRYPDRLIFHPSLPYKEYIKITASADFYIDSFPLPGGTAFVEQFIYGKPCIGLHTEYFGYTPLEAVKKNTVDEVMDFLKNPPSSSLIDELQLKIFKVHSFAKVKERFTSSLYNNESYENPMIGYIEEKSIIKNNVLYLSKSLLRKVYLINKIIFFQLLFIKINNNWLLPKIRKIFNRNEY